jgi:hypothetical protein
MLRSTPQTGSFAKIAHRAIFKRSALAGARTLTRFSFSASSLHALSNAFFLYRRAVIVHSMQPFDLKFMILNAL